MEKGCFKDCFCAKEGIINENKSHFRRGLAGISTRFKNTKGGDPEQKLFRMTSCFFTCHAGKPLLSISSAFKKQGGDPRVLRTAKSGMTFCKVEALNKDSFRAPLRFGFTLIELLVVVLIIGILAAVALPQYQKAVEKARATEVIMFLKNAASAIDVFVLQNGFVDKNFTTDMSSLDMDIPLTNIEDMYDISLACWGAPDYLCSIMLYGKGGNVGDIRYDREQTETAWSGWCHSSETVCGYLEQNLNIKEQKN